MKILLFLHELAMGGTTVNAIELATTLRDLHGHEVVLFAAPGPMQRLVQASALRHLVAPRASMHPCLARVKALRSAIRNERPDLVYVWETWALADAFVATLPGARRVPLLVTDMQMFVSRLLPRHVPTTFGTAGLVETARRQRVRHVELVVPPVDLQANQPAAVDAAAARRQLRIDDGQIALVIVSRLAAAMKGESLGYAIDAVACLGRRYPLSLVIVGDGEARHSLQLRAEVVNAALGRPAVVLTGAMLDPRPAYAAADVVIGMGGSALRGMAFGKPLIVVGEGGFAAVMDHETKAQFVEQGFFGIGRGRGEADLVSAIEKLAGSAALRESLGRQSLAFVRSHHSLEAMAAKLDRLCRGAVALRPTTWQVVFETFRLGCVYLRERRFLWRSRVPESFAVSRPEAGERVIYAIERETPP